MTVTSTDHDRAAGALRVLLAVHGGEPAGWGLEVRRILATWSAPSIRVLAVVDAPRVSFTSLLPAAARRHHGASRAWARLEQERLQRLLDDLLPLLPGALAPTWIHAAQADPGRAIAEDAATWQADVVLVGAAPAAGPFLGAVHERLIRHAPCPVLVTPVPVAPRRRARVPAPAAARARRRAPVAAGQEA
jgi:nucleotide-binding universal stress UspA family protein